MSCMYPFQVRWAWSSWLATVVTDVGKTHPESEICPSGAMVAVDGKSTYCRQSAWLRGLGAWPEIRAT